MIQEILPPQRFSIEQPYHFPGQYEPQTTGARGDISTSHESRDRWGLVNIDAGGRSANLSTMAFFIGMIQKWVCNFQDPENNFFARWFDKLLYTASSMLEGQRDSEMYQNIYGMGIGKDLTKEEIQDQNLTMRSGKVPYIDDWLENKNQESLYGEKLVPWFGELAHNAARIKPFSNGITGLFLGRELGRSIEVLLDLPARIYWRLRFYGTALHANFVMAAWNLVKFRTLSFFNNPAKTDFKKLVSDLGNKSGEYFKNKYPSDHSNLINGKTGLALYWSMLKDRMSEHWGGISKTGAKKILERKVEDKFLVPIIGEIKEEDDAEQLEKSGLLVRKKNPERTLSRGYADPNYKGDIAEQRRLSIVSFTAPIVATLGLISTVVFVPLKCVWGITGMEKFKYTVDVLASSGKSFQLFNYLFRFIIPEMQEGSGYKELESSATKENASEPLKQLYQARKMKYKNALLGLMVTAGSLFEPFGHFFKQSFIDNKFYHFLFDTLIKFNDDFFLRFFSERRKCMGLETYLRSYVGAKKEEQEGREVQHVGVNDFESVSDTLDNLRIFGAERMKNQRIYKAPKLSSWLSNLLNSVKQNLDSIRNFSLAA